MLDRPGWLGDRMREREEWRCAVGAVGGAQCVISSGALDTLVLCADSWATVTVMVSLIANHTIRKIRIFIEIEYSKHHYSYLLSSKCNKNACTIITLFPGIEFVLEYYSLSLLLMHI